MSSSGNSTNARAEVCRRLGLRDEAEAYQLVTRGARQGEHLLLSKGLGAQMLVQLGYTASAMKRLGYSGRALATLGYGVVHEPKREPEQALTAPTGPTEQVASGTEIRQLLSSELTAGELIAKGYTVHHFKKAGCSVQELERAGFRPDDLVPAFSAADLRRAGHTVVELRRFFSGPELRSAGFEASDMRNAGFSIRELLRFGYNENQVRIAGFSMVELGREGLSKQTVDKTRHF